MSLEFNKIAAAVLTAGIIAMFSSFIARELFHHEPLEEHAYKVAVVEGAGTGGATQPAEPTIEPVLPLLADADVAKGEQVFKQCATCHDVTQGGPNKVGPNLWNIVGAPHAHAEGYNYSSAMQALHDKPWTYEDLNHFLLSPRGYIPGTKMTFAGVRRVQDRADVIAYLRTLSDNPAPLPTQEEIDAVTQKDEGTEDGGDAPTGPASGEPAGAGEEHQPSGTVPTDTSPSGEVPADSQPSEEQPTGEQPSGGQPSGEQPSGGQPSGEEPAEQAPADQQGSNDRGDEGALLQQIAAADPAQGQKVARQCVACHTFEKGGINKVGPNLWDIVGGPFAHKDDYNYSSAFKTAKEEGKVWTFEALAAYLAAPRDFLPGNKMTYAGLRKAEDRAAVLAYLHSLSDDPAPLQ